MAGKLKPLDVERKVRPNSPLQALHRITGASDTERTARIAGSAKARSTTCRYQRDRLHDQHDRQDNALLNVREADCLQE